MKVHDQPLSDVTRYLDSKSGLTLADMEPQHQQHLNIIRRFHTLNKDIQILEIGTGTGWFPLLCARDGYACKGLEISPQLIEFAHALGKAEGIQPDIELGNIEETDIGDSQYDVIFSNAVFEHIEHWPLALERVYRALKPGGMFYFASTNRFSPISDEYRKFPLYGWLPDPLRYKLRQAIHGPDIMKLGIDFNQFTYPQLRREFKRVGFTKILDRIATVDLDRVSSPVGALIKTARVFPPLKHTILTFSRATQFVCIK